MLKLDQELLDKHLKVIPSPADGHCLFHSFISSWNTQFSHLPPVTFDEIVSSAKREWNTDPVFYTAFLVENAISVDEQWNSYIYRGHYYQSLGDIFPNLYTSIEDNQMEMFLVNLIWKIF